jgi:hypothetical protein
LFGGSIKIHTSEANETDDATQTRNEKMNAAQAKMTQYAKSQTTETLIDALKKLNCDYRPEAIIASTFITRELADRMSYAEFLELMQWCEAELDALA